MKTKEEILKGNGWVEFVGFCFPSPRAEEEEDLTFVSKEEAFEVISKGVKTYWYSDIRERIYTLDDAWDYFTEDYCDKNKLDFNTQEEIDKYLLERKW